MFSDFTFQTPLGTSILLYFINKNETLLPLYRLTTNENTFVYVCAVLFLKFLDKREIILQPLRNEEKCRYPIRFEQYLVHQRFGVIYLIHVALEGFSCFCRTYI